MSIRQDFTGADEWFAGDDIVLIFVDVEDISGWDLEFNLIEVLSGDVVLTKTTGGGIAITATDTGEVTIGGADTISLPTDIAYRYNYRRTDVSAILSYGSAVLLTP